MHCNIRVENCHFDGVNKVWANYGGANNGRIGWKGLKLTGAKQPAFMKNSFPVFNPPYGYSAGSADSVKSQVMSGAGNC